MKPDVIRLSRRTTLVLPLAGLAMADGAAPAIAQGAAEGSTLTVDGVLAYLGVVPAAIVQGHPRQHPEATMHGGPDDSKRDYHLILALFAEDSGTRIETAEVQVNVMGLGHIGGTRLTLDPMQIAGTVTWGTFVDLPSRDIYELTFSVTLPDRKGEIVFPFRYRLSDG